MRNVPVRLVSTTAFQALRCILFAMRGNCPPPLFTRKSMCPRLSIVDAIVDLTFSSFFMLHLKYLISPTSDSSFAAFASFSSFLDAMATLQPVNREFRTNELAKQSHTYAYPM